MLEYEDSTLVSCKSFIEDELLTKEMKKQFKNNVKQFWLDQINNFNETIQY